MPPLSWSATLHHLLSVEVGISRDSVFMEGLRLEGVHEEVIIIALRLVAYFIIEWHGSACATSLLFLLGGLGWLAWLLRFG